MYDNRRAILISEARGLMTTFATIYLNQLSRPDRARIRRLFEQAQARYFRRIKATR